MPYVLCRRAEAVRQERQAELADAGKIFLEENVKMKVFKLQNQAYSTKY